MLLHEGGHNTSVCPSQLGSLLLSVAYAFVFLISISSCRPAIVRVPVTPEDIIKANSVALEGDIAFARKDYYAALIKFLEASKLNPNSEHIANKLGIAYSRLGSPKESAGREYYLNATAAFNRAIGLNPKFSYAYNNMGSVYFAANNKKKAGALFRKAISLNGNEASFHVNLGTLLFEEKKFEKGLQEYRKALSINPNVLKQSAGEGIVALTNQKSAPEKSYYMARFYASQGSTEQAVESLKQALSDGFTNLEAIRTEKDFDPIRKDERFITFLQYAAQIIK